LDSGAGQCLIASAGAFQATTVRVCYITIEGVCGDLVVTGVGTAWLVVIDDQGEEVILIVHQCLQSNGVHNLLSVAQLLQMPNLTVQMSKQNPTITMIDDTDDRKVSIPLRLMDGVFVLPFAIVSPTDPRLRRMRRATATPDRPYIPPTELFPVGHPAAGTYIWRSIVHQGPADFLRAGKFAVPTIRGLVGFRQRIRDAAAEVFVDSTSRPEARRTYSHTVPESMADLSTRMMGTSYQRLKHTIDVSKGLSKRKGTLKANRFPQGNLKRGQVPAVKKRLVHHLHQASVAEVVFTDTFQSDDAKYAYGQAFVCYRSRFGHVVCIKSRREVGKAFRRFCADVFRPLILVRDNISEQKFGEMMDACVELMVQSAFSTPYTPEEDYAEGFIGRVCQLASFAMLYAGAPTFMWRFAIISAVFVYNLTAGWYSAEQLWATPYELVYGEPFPDSSIMMPWGCGALILLRKEDRGKFGNRCALVVFAHYATQHPTYCYAFWNPRTGRIVYRRDAIFLVDVFPMRWGQKPGCKDGAMVTPYKCERAPSSMRGEEDDFPDWAGPTLPMFTDCVTTSATSSVKDKDRKAIFPDARTVSKDPGRHPAHEAFGSSSTVCVPPPTTLSRAIGESPIAIGTSFTKDFGHHGHFVGTVKSYELETALYQVTYPDGDGEDFTEADLLTAIQVSTTLSPTRKGLTTAPAPGRVKKLTTGLNGKKWTRPLGGRRGLASSRRPLKPDPVLTESVVRSPASSAPVQNLVVKTVDPGLDGTAWKTPTTSSRSSKTVHFAREGDQGAPTSTGSTCSGPVQAAVPIPDKTQGRNTTKALSPLSDAWEPTAPPAVTHGCDFIVPGELSENWRAFPVFDTDAQCDEVVGKTFCHSSHGDCAITHWEVTVNPDRSTSRWIYFTGERANQDYERASLPEIQAWVRRDAPLKEMEPPTTRLFWPKVCGLFGMPPEEDEVYVPKVRMLVAALQSSMRPHDVQRWPMQHISKSDIKLMLSARPSIFKFGVQVPRNDGEADRSPERIQWKAGRTLEWLRLKKVGAFDGSWTKERIRKELPHFQIVDIGHCFFIYNYKCTGERRVRMVYDGSRQSPNTYGDTYAPTVRPESIRLFHLYCVENDYDIGQYDVPQAFLQAKAKGDLFFYPPEGCAEFPGQIYKCLLNLYGNKEAARLYYLRFTAFLTTLGFESEARDPCFFRRYEPSTGKYSLLICHVDDSRIGAAPAILKEIYAALHKEFAVTTCSGSRFLGMDVIHDRTAGFLKLHMQTYISEMVTRFEAVDTTAGYPVRELVGCLIWVVCCVHGGDLMRVKALARCVNDFDAADYATGLKLMYRLQARTDKGIMFRRHGAGHETVPDNRRLKAEDGSVTPYYIGPEDIQDEFGEKDVYRSCDVVEDAAHAAELNDIPESSEFTIVSYTDASFAATDLMQSISGWLVYCNGSPILWGSLRQATVVDSSCSAEYVASSICCKKVKELENMLLFLKIRCPRPYTMYTDSQAAMAISNNLQAMGNVRHLSIRTHVTRCYISLGDICLKFCLTEQMVADLFTKIVTAAQEGGLLDRFYNDVSITFE
jgi:hypothetical protein